MSTRTMHILQKLGFPTKLATSYQAYYDSPIEDMAHGESIQIYPGVNKLDYRMDGMFLAQRVIEPSTLL
jgi:hypothetical protein